jgi:TolA-binding protein
LLIVLFVFVPCLSFAKDPTQTEAIIKDILGDGSSQKNESVRPASEPDADNTAVPKKKDLVKDQRKDQTKPVISTEEEAMLKTGTQFYNNGIYVNALKVFGDFLGKYPQGVLRDSARVWSGKTFLRLYKYEDALKEFSQIPAESGEYPAALYYSGECNMIKGESMAALEFYQQLFSRFPVHELADDSLLAAAKIYLSIKKGGQALDSIVNMIKYFKDRETIDDAYFILAKTFETDPTLKDFETARRIYRLFIKKAESNEEQFARSPLLSRVKRDLDRLQRIHFKMER